jgi:hypothetical protein
MAGRDKADPGPSPPPADRPWLPDPREVVAVKTVTSPKGGKPFEILETKEEDEYDRPEPPGAKDPAG